MPDVFEVLREDHDEVKAMLARLAEGPKAGTGATAEQLASRKRLVARAHIAYEEAHAWPLLQAAITADQARELGDLIARAKDAAPTRPHPNIPATENATKAVGPIAGIADRLRDAVTGRGRG